MNQDDTAIKALRSALDVSPDNIPLRLHLADTLLSAGRSDEALEEYHVALKHDPDNVDARLALARLYMLQNKISHALVIVEEMIDQGNAGAATHLMYARLCYQEENISRAVAQYKLAVEMDPDMADEALAEQLGIDQEDEFSELVDGKIRVGSDDVVSQFETQVERPQVDFSDVGGMHDLKEEINLKIIYPLKQPEIYASYGKKIGGGIMMYGPPGCGKTWMARATAGEINAGFISVGINDVLDMWSGQSERNLHSLFENARENKPCVLFFDEVDALGGRRSDMASASSRQLINQFLSELDGIEANNEGVLILSATNAPWHVDPAFRRPGRFDQVLFVPPPDAVAREEIFRIHLQGKPLGDVDYTKVAKKTDKFSGADIKAVIDKAVELKLKDALKTGVPQPVTTRDLLKAVSEVKPTTREWFSTARNYALYSNQGGAYDDVIRYLKL